MNKNDSQCSEKITDFSSSLEGGAPTPRESNINSTRGESDPGCDYQGDSPLPSVSPPPNISFSGSSLENGDITKAYRRLEKVAFFSDYTDSSIYSGWSDGKRDSAYQSENHDHEEIIGIHGPMPGIDILQNNVQDSSITGDSSSSVYPPTESEKDLGTNASSIITNDDGTSLNGSSLDLEDSPSSSLASYGVICEDSEDEYIPSPIIKQLTQISIANNQKCGSVYSKSPSPIIRDVRYIQDKSGTIKRVSFGVDELKDGDLNGEESCGTIFQSPPVYIDPERGSESEDFPKNPLGEIIKSKAQRERKVKRTIYKPSAFGDVFPSRGLIRIDQRKEREDRMAQVKMESEGNKSNIPGFTVTSSDTPENQASPSPDLKPKLLNIGNPLTVPPEFFEKANTKIKKIRAADTIGDRLANAQPRVDGRLDGDEGVVVTGEGGAGGIVGLGKHAGNNGHLLKESMHIIQRERCIKGNTEEACNSVDLDTSKEQNVVLTRGYTFESKRNIPEKNDQGVVITSKLISTEKSECDVVRGKNEPVKKEGTFVTREITEINQVVYLDVTKSGERRTPKLEEPNVINDTSNHNSIDTYATTHETVKNNLPRDSTTIIQHGGKPSDEISENPGDDLKLNRNKTITYATNSTDHTPRASEKNVRSVQTAHTFIVPNEEANSSDKDERHLEPLDKKSLQPGAIENPTRIEKSHTVTIERKVKQKEPAVLAEKSGSTIENPQLKSADADIQPKGNISPVSKSNTITIVRKGTQVTHCHNALKQEEKASGRPIDVIGNPEVVDNEIRDKANKSGEDEIMGIRKEERGRTFEQKEETSYKIEGNMKKVNKTDPEIAPSVNAMNKQPISSPPTPTNVVVANKVSNEVPKYKSAIDKGANEGTMDIGELTHVRDKSEGKSTRDTARYEQIPALNQIPYSGTNAMIKESSTSSESCNGQEQALQMSKGIEMDDSVIVRNSGTNMNGTNVSASSDNMKLNDSGNDKQILPTESSPLVTEETRQGRIKPADGRISQEMKEYNKDGNVESKLMLNDTSNENRNEGDIYEELSKGSTESVANAVKYSIGTQPKKDEIRSNTNNADVKHNTDSEARELEVGGPSAGSSNKSVSQDTSRKDIAMEKDKTDICSKKGSGYVETKKKQEKNNQSEISETNTQKTNVSSNDKRKLGDSDKGKHEMPTDTSSQKNIDSSQSQIKQALGSMPQDMNRLNKDDSADSQLALNKTSNNGIQDNQNKEISKEKKDRGAKVSKPNIETNSEKVNSNSSSVVMKTTNTEGRVLQDGDQRLSSNESPSPCTGRKGKVKKELGMVDEKDEETCVGNNAQSEDRFRKSDISKADIKGAAVHRKGGILKLVQNDDKQVTTVRNSPMTGGPTSSKPQFAEDNLDSNKEIPRQIGNQVQTDENEAQDQSYLNLKNADLITSGGVAGKSIRRNPIQKSDDSMRYSPMTKDGPTPSKPQFAEDNLDSNKEIPRQIADQVQTDENKAQDKSYLNLTNTDLITSGGMTGKGNRRNSVQKMNNISVKGDKGESSLRATSQVSQEDEPVIKEIKEMQPIVKCITAEDKVAKIQTCNGNSTKENESMRHVGSDIIDKGVEEDKQVEQDEQELGYDSDELEKYSSDLVEHIINKVSVLAESNGHLKTISPNGNHSIEEKKRATQIENNQHEVKSNNKVASVVASVPKPEVVVHKRGGHRDKLQPQPKKASHTQKVVNKSSMEIIAESEKKINESEVKHSIGTGTTENETKDKPVSLNLQREPHPPKDPRPQTPISVRNMRARNRVQRTVSTTTEDSQKTSRSFVRKGDTFTKEIPQDQKTNSKTRLDTSHKTTRSIGSEERIKNVPTKMEPFAKNSTSDPHVKSTKRNVGKRPVSFIRERRLKQIAALKSGRREKESRLNRVLHQQKEIASNSNIHDEKDIKDESIAKETMDGEIESSSTYIQTIRALGTGARKLRDLETLEQVSRTAAILHMDQSTPSFEGQQSLLYQTRGLKTLREIRAAEIEAKRSIADKTSGFKPKREKLKPTLPSMLKSDAYWQNGKLHIRINGSAYVQSKLEEVWAESEKADNVGNLPLDVHITLNNQRRKLSDLSERRALSRGATDISTAADVNERESQRSLVGDGAFYPAFKAKTARVKGTPRNGVPRLLGEGSGLHNAGKDQGEGGNRRPVSNVQDAPPLPGQMPSNM